MRDLARVGVQGSNPFARSKKEVAPIVRCPEGSLRHRGQRAPAFVTFEGVETVWAAQRTGPRPIPGDCGPSATPWLFRRLPTVFIGWRRLGGVG